MVAILVTKRPGNYICESLTLIIALICHLMSNCIQQVLLRPCSYFRVAGERDVGEPVVTAITDPTAGYSKLCSLPGILLVVAHHEVFLFDPDTLAPLTVVPKSNPIQTPPLSVHNNVIVSSGIDVIGRAAVLWVNDLTEA